MSCNRIVTNELVLNDTEGHERAQLSARDGYGVLTLPGSPDRTVVSWY